MLNQLETAIFTGVTCLPGSLLLQKFSTASPGSEVLCLVRPTSDYRHIHESSLNINYLAGDSSDTSTWTRALLDYTPKTIVHIASIRHIPAILESISTSQQTPRLIIVGTTGVYSRYNEFSKIYKRIVAHLSEYRGSYCLLQPTMIYGSHRDKNLHKLIRFCDRYSFFPVFGSGKNLLQPVHADDLAQAILSVFLNPDIKGAYDLSGGTVVTFNELIELVSKLLGKPVRPLRLPYTAGLWSATLSEKILGQRSPVRREQILRLQEDKAYSHEAATQDFGYQPRSLEVGLRQEIEILRAERIIS